MFSRRIIQKIAHSTHSTHSTRRAKSDFIRLNDNVIINRKSVVSINLYTKNGFSLFKTKYYVDFIHSDINVSGYPRSDPFLTSVFFRTEEARDNFINDEFINDEFFS